MNPVPSDRVRVLNQAAVQPRNQFVVYWMTAFRRLHCNFALQRAVEWANQLQRPLLILEALRCDYPWASVRLHTFVLQGMRDQQQQARGTAAAYYPYVEPAVGAGSGLLEALAQRACLIVSDDFPCFFLPRMLQAVARRIPVPLEVVDSNGLLPLSRTASDFPTAYAFRRFLQQNLSPHLTALPETDPLAALRVRSVASIPVDILQRWPAAGEDLLLCQSEAVQRLPIDTSVGPGAVRGGAVAAAAQLQSFLTERLPRYADDRNQPDDDAASGLSPWLHFGQISTQQIFQQLITREGWSPDCLGDVRQTRGSREGWWGMSRAAEAFLDELVTWRELGFNMCFHRPDYDQYSSLPAWAQQTLAEHADDPRPVIYSREELLWGQTHDTLWNAAQNQLRTEGRMHNYLRMLWGKKILEWSRSPQEALQHMLELNNGLALDGRNPNSYSGIFWVLGRYDRAWGPERPIFGKIRYMSSDNTARKLHVERYLQRYAAESAPGRRKPGAGRLF